jgi:hypothetical protein
MIECYRVRFIGEFVAKKEIPDIIQEYYFLTLSSAKKKQKQLKEYHDVQNELERWIPIDKIKVEE